MTDNAIDHDAIERELFQLLLGRVGVVDWGSREGAAAVAASFRRETELWGRVVDDRASAPLLLRAAAVAQSAATENADFWGAVAGEQEPVGHPA